jgi:hypothetical protein
MQRFMGFEHVQNKRAKPDNQPFWYWRSKTCLCHC